MKSLYRRFCEWIYEHPIDALFLACMFDVWLWFAVAWWYAVVGG